MRTIETLVSPKHRAGGGQGEDLAGHHLDTFWLLDGASTPHRWAFATPQPSGAWLATQVDLAFRQILAAAPATPLAALVTEASRRVSALLTAEHPQATAEQLATGAPHTTLVLVRLQQTKLEYLLLQDSVLLVRPHAGSEIVELKDTRQDRFNAEFYREAHDALRAGDAYGPRYNRILDVMVDRERIHRNKPGGFFTFTGEDIASAAVVGEVEVDSQCEVLLASDGGARYWTCFPGQRQDVLERPLHVLAEVVRTFEALDPLGAQYPRVGSQDDIAFLRVLPAGFAPQN